MYCPEAHDKMYTEDNSRILLQPQFFSSVCMCISTIVCACVGMSGNLRYCSLGATFFFLFLKTGSPTGLGITNLARQISL